MKTRRDTGLRLLYERFTHGASIDGRNENQERYWIATVIQQGCVAADSQRVEMKTRRDTGLRLPQDMT